jgi:hypothetical protein
MIIELGHYALVLALATCVIVSILQDRRAEVFAVVETFFCQGLQLQRTKLRELTGRVEWTDRRHATAASAILQDAMGCPGFARREREPSVVQAGSAVASVA